MQELKVASIPAPLGWQNAPVDGIVHGEDGLEILSGGKTDYFIDPDGRPADTSAPAAVFAPPHASFILSARVKVDFQSTYDAGVLLMLVRGDLWAKLCYEFSPQREPMIVSVVTRGVSDDCNSVALRGDTVYLRIAQGARSTAFHYSLDGRSWNLVRHFTLGSTTGVRLGFSSQSPTGTGSRAVFSDIRYTSGSLGNIRSGE